MRIGRGNTVGLVVDIQERLVPVMSGKEQLLKNCRMLIEGLQVLKVPVLVTQQYTQGLGMTVPEISSVINEFRPIEKRDFSCCGEPGVMDELRRLGAQNVIICGIESHVCVLQTALDLKDAGFTPVIVFDAVSSRYPENLELARERFRHEGIMMTSAESVLFELTVSSAAPEFKAISRLVK